MDIIKYINDRIDGAKVKLSKKGDMAEMLFASVVINGTTEKKKYQCLSIEEGVYFASKGISSDSENEILEHLCTCSSCRKMIREIAEASKNEDLHPRTSLYEKAFKTTQVKKFNFNFDKFSVSKFFPAVCLVILFVVLLIYSINNLLNNNEHPDKFKVNVQKSFVSLLASEDEFLLRGSVMSSQDASGSYNLEDKKLLRAGYMFFMIQNADTRNDILEDIVSRDIATSADEHFRVSIMFGEANYEKIIDFVSELGSKKLTVFNNGYLLAYLVYLQLAKMDEDFVDGYISDRDLDDKFRMVEIFLDEYDKNLGNRNFSFLLRKPIMSLELK